MRIEEGFQQKAPQLELSWSGPGQRSFRALVQRLLAGTDYFDQVDADMREFEKRIAGPVRAARLLTAEPKIESYDQYGQRVDTLRTSEGWRLLKAMFAEEGFMKTGYERPYGELSRVVSFAKGVLWAPESAYVGCPGAMTDGCVRILELSGTPEMKRDVLPRLLSTDPKTAWTAGQWMTERPGGSDVSLTETVARRIDASSGDPKPGDWYELDGFKWFSSATDGNVAVALARTGGEESGARGLSLFLVPLRKEDGTTNGIFVHRLKNKFGTKALPTAELSISGARGQLIGLPGDGVKLITPVLNITRIHSGTSSVASLSRALEIARAFARVRHIGGRNGTLLMQNDMHTTALAQAELVLRALQQLGLGTALLLGRSEVGSITERETQLLRLLTPVLKTFAADKATTATLGLMDALGGQGYMTENQLGEMLADGCVEKVWEGTTNTLALDVVRVVIKSKGAAIQALVEWSSEVIASIPASEEFSTVKRLLESDFMLIGQAAQQFTSPNVDLSLAVPLLNLIGFVASTTFLLEQAAWSQTAAPEDHDVDKAVAVKWADCGGARETRRALRDMIEGRDGRPQDRELNHRMVYGVSKM